MYSLIFGSVVALQRVEEDEEAKYLVVCRAFPAVQTRIVLHILGEIYFFRNPEVVHCLPIPVAHPFIPHIVEVVKVCRVSPNHPSEACFRVASRIEQGVLLQFHNFHFTCFVFEFRIT